MKEKELLKGKRALVTGSTSGIGLGIARALAAEGARVMINGFGEQVDQLRKEFPAYSAADMSKPDQVRAMIDEATKALGGVDILVNNAGIQHTASIEEFPAERWDAILAINLSSNFHAIAAVLPQMRSRNWGRIINIASTHGLVASVNKVGYVAAKHAVVGLTKVVALETATTGITCNAICPGWVLTPLVQKQVDAWASRDKIPMEEAKIALLSEKQPSRQFTTPEQLGALAVFLCSEAAVNVRGAAWTVDGGWTAQ